MNKFLLLLIANSLVFGNKLLAMEIENNDQALFDQEMDPDLALGLAAVHFNIAGIHSALAQGANVNATFVDGQTALMLVSQEDFNPNTLPVLQVLIDAGADINIANNFGDTVLTLALHEVDGENVALFLIGAGADIELADHFGGTPLMWAVLADDINVLHALLNRHANVNRVDDKGKTALIYAATSGEENSLIILQSLLAVGANVNTADFKGRTALMWAAKRGWVEAVTTLLNAGANVALEDYNGRTALMRAQERGHADVALLLELAAVG